MPEMRLLTLHLGAPLLYSLSGAEEDRLFTFEEIDLFEFAEGFPRLRDEIGAARFSGGACETPGGPEVWRRDSAYTVDPGDYAFVQWTAGSSGAAAPGEFPGKLGEFARLLQLKRRETFGPYLVRVLDEDGRTVCQALRALKIL